MCKPHNLIHLVNNAGDGSGLGSLVHCSHTLIDASKLLANLQNHTCMLVVLVQVLVQVQLLVLVLVLVLVLTLCSANASANAIAL